MQEKKRKGKTDPIHVRLPKSVLDKLDQMSDRTGWTRTKLVTLACDRFTKQCDNLLHFEPVPLTPERIELRERIRNVFAWTAQDWVNSGYPNGASADRTPDDAYHNLLVFHKFRPHIPENY
jgi:hypothetical protein